MLFVLGLVILRCLYRALMQGDVESIASKNPKARAEEKPALVYQEKRTVTMERKQKKAQKEEAEQYIRLQEELVFDLTCISGF